jgi:NAD(P)-dependent dehydrogenase (short-subunit alcohol dehydrogenase family)
MAGEPAIGVPAIVVPGASTGIGRACVGAAAARGAHVFATVRTQKDCEGLGREFAGAVTPLVMDVTDAAAIAAAASAVGAALSGRPLYGLVNNAGFFVAGPIELMPLADLKRQFDVNLFGVHAVTQAFLPLLKAQDGQPPGRVVMMSSVGGRDAQPFAGAYAASKHALEGYAQSLRRELMVYGVKVIVVAPGTVKTPIWDKVAGEDVARFAGTAYEGPIARMMQLMPGIQRAGLAPSAIAEAVWRALSAAQPPQRITRVAGFRGWAQISLPPPIIDAAIANVLQLKAQK